MKTPNLSEPACSIAGRRRITSDDVLRLRTQMFPKGIATIADAHTLLAIHRACPDQARAWETYFVESLAAFVIDRGHDGSVDEATCGWLIRVLAGDEEVIATWPEIELVLHIIEMASATPDSLRAFALDQLRLAFRPGASGAYALQRPASRGMTGFDLAYVWRILKSAVDQGRLDPSPAEAMILAEIAALAAFDDSHSGWQQVVADLCGSPDGDMPATAVAAASRRSGWLVIEGGRDKDDQQAA